MASLRNEGKFRNYISALAATFKTGEALENFTEQGLLAVHNHIKNKVGILPPCLNQCSQNGGDINRWCVTCISWRQELENFIPRGVRRNWQGTASWCWPNGAKEIAEVFVFKFPGQGNRNINLKDMTTIFNVWNRCLQFQRPVVNLLEILKESRNELVHNANMKLSNAKKTLIFQQINNVVSHPDIQQTLHNHADFLQTLHELENGELFMEDFERALQAIGLQNAEIEFRLNDLSSTVNETNRKMLTHIFRLSVFIVILVFAILFKEPPAYIAQQIIGLNNLPMQATMDSINERMSKMTLSSQAGCLPEKSETMRFPPIALMDYIAHHQHFVGREWLTHLTERKLLNANETNRGVILEAGMGYGKSAFLKKIICSSRNESFAVIRSRLVAFHVCRFDALISKQIFVFVFRLINMMFAQMPFMNDDIKTCIDIFDKDMCKSDPYGCLDQCLIVPLNKMSKPKDKPVIIIIDGLDECFDDSRGVNDILRTLQKRLHLFPLWIKFLVSTRPDPRIKHLTVDLHVMRLNDYSSENMNDIVIYRKHLSSNMSVSFTNKYKNINVSNFLLLSLLHQSIGTTEAIQSGQLFPSSLYLFYEHQFQRFFTSKYGETFINSKTILEVIYSSFEPPTRDKVWLIVSDVTSMTFKQFNSCFQLLDNFFHKIENEIHFFHLSFREWLIDESNIDFSIDIERGHELNALYLFQQIGYGNFENDIIDLVMHSVPKLTMLQTEQNKDEYPLFRLVRRRDSSEAINLLMYHFEDIDVRNKDNVTALYIAASLGHVTAFNALILKGSNVSFRTNSYSKIINFEEAFTVSVEHQHWDYGIMDIAAQHGHENVVKYVLENNNHLFNYPITRYNSMHLLPIHLACKKGHTTIVKLLHSKYKWMLDWQCLYYASEIGRLCLVNYILDNGIEDKCYKCESHMSWIKKGQFRVQGHVFRDSEVMDKGLSYVLLDDWAKITCESALHIAVRENKLDVVKILINKSKRTSYCYDRGGKTPVISALQYGNQGIVEYFLSIGILIGNETCATIRPLNDSFKLHEKEVTRLGKSFCENHMTVPHILAKYNHIILSHMLIRSGIALNWMTKDMEGCYPIHLAACHGSVEMLSYLLKHFVMHFELFMCANGSTALHSAVECRSPSSTKILLMHNKNYSGESKSKMFMYIKLAMNTSYEPELASNYMDIEIRISKIIFMLISKDWDFNITDAFGRNILHYAITQGHFKVVLELFKNFRDESNILLEAEDIDNRTPLRYALLKLKPFSSFFLPNQSFGNSTFGPTDESIDQMTANEYTLLLTLDFMIKSNILSFRQDIFRQFVKKQCVYVVIFLLEAKGHLLYSQTDMLSDIIQQDRYGVQTLAFYFVYIKRLLPKLVADYKTDISDLLISCSACNELLYKCQTHSIALNYLKLSSLLRLIGLDKIIFFIQKFIFHNSLSHLMSTCYDQDGFNVLERAIQGGSPELVKYLIENGVKTNEDKNKLIEMALNGLKYRKENKHVPIISITKSNIIKISFLKFETIINAFGSHKIHDFSTFYFSTNINMKKEDFYGLVSIRRIIYDELVSNLLTSYRHEISKWTICLNSSRKFSIIHRLAFDGLKNSIVLAVKYWGKDILQCKNIDEFTPLYLSKVFRYDDTTDFIKAQGIPFTAPSKSAEIYFLFKLVFKYNFSRYEKKHVLCIMSYTKIVPNTSYKKIKAYNCVKKVIRILKSSEYQQGVNDFKWKLSFYIESITWQHLMLQFLKTLGVSLKTSDVLNSYEWDSLENYALTKLNYVRFIYSSISSHTTASSKEQAKLIRIADAENRTCNYLRISLKKVILILKGEAAKCLKKCSLKYMILQELNTILEDIARYKWGTFNCSDFVMSCLYWRMEMDFFKLIRDTFPLLRINMLSSVLKEGFYVPFYLQRTDFTHILKDPDTWLRLYNKYNYMNVLQISPILKESFLYKSKSIDTFSRYTTGMLNNLQFIEWNSNAEKLFEQYMTSKDAK